MSATACVFKMALGMGRGRLGCQINSTQEGGECKKRSRVVQVLFFFVSLFLLLFRSFFLFVFTRTILLMITNQKGVTLKFENSQ